MPVGIVAGQRLDPVPPEDAEHSETAAEAGEWSQSGHPPVVYLVDDNFIGNRKAARDLLPHLIDWQKRRG